MDKVSLEKQILSRHGGGGSAMGEFIGKYVLQYLSSPDSWKKRFNVQVPLEALDDAAVINDTVFATDSHVVKPIFFPGGDIGRLSVSGTVNDVSVMGAEPMALSFGLVLEEGFPFDDLRRILESMGKTCEEARVHVATGDTKVVEGGALDKIIINTAGIGRRSKSLDHNLEMVKNYRKLNWRWLADSNVMEGDKIIVSGTMGDHGITIMSAQNGYDFNIHSDVAPMNGIIEKILQIGGIVAIKDPTRGGLANVLYEWSEKSKTGIIVKEESIPVRGTVREAAEILGINPLHTGNEGKLVIAVVPQKADDILEVLKKTEGGKDAAIIGEAARVFGDHVLLDKGEQGKAVLPSPSADPVPRVC